MRDGILISGGGSLLYGIAERIETETKIQVKRSKDPLTCVAEGTGIILGDKKLMDSISTAI